MNTREMREQAAALLSVAETELEKGEVDSFNRMITEAQEKMEQADTFDQAATKMAALKGDFDRPLNPVPVTSNDVAIYDPTDTTARIKANYKPASWVKGLPAMAQPLWVQDLCGDNVKDEARFMSDTFVKWFQSPSDDFFWKTASPDEAKAMQEDTDKLLCPVN